MQLVLASLAAISFTAGGVFMKLAGGLRNVPAAASFLALFVIGAALQAEAMRGQELGTTYIVVLGLEAALALAFGRLLFAEPITLAKMGGVLLVVGGIAMLRST